MAGWCENEYGCLGALDVGDDDFPLNCPAWDITDLQALWVEHAIRADSVLLPTAAGQRSYPSRYDESDYELTLFVNGYADQNGVAHDDAWMGLWANLQTLISGAFGPVTTGRGTIPATLTLPDGATKMKADVKFTLPRAVNPVEDPGYAVYRVTLTVPAGRFVLVGS